jgi:hypothetical protein
MKKIYILFLMVHLVAVSLAQTDGHKFSLSSYGEMLYQYFDYGSNQRATLKGSKEDSRALIDIPRFILETKYNFLPDLFVEAEIEFEHLGTGSALELEYEEFGEYEFEVEKGGEVEIEELFISKSFSPEINIRVGKFPIPFSLFNKAHKPTDFFATVQPESERMIIPATWSETGIEFFGTVYNFNYRLAVVNGLDAAGFSSERWIAEGYQTHFETVSATNMAVVARLDYVPVTKFLIGGSIYYGNSSDNRPKSEDMEGIDAHVTVISLHTQYLESPVIVRGDFIYGSLENSDIVSQRNARLSTKIQYSRSPVAKNALAWYAEGGYDILTFFSQLPGYKLYPFIRYEHYNTMQEVERGVFANPRFKRSILTFGLNFIWNNEIVVKFDYASREVGGGNYNTENTFGFGFGYNTTFIK